MLTGPLMKEDKRDQTSILLETSRKAHAFQTFCPDLCGRLCLGSIFGALCSSAAVPSPWPLALRPTARSRPGQTMVCPSFVEGMSPTDAKKSRRLCSATGVVLNKCKTQGRRGITVLSFNCFDRLKSATECIQEIGNTSWTRAREEAPGNLKKRRLHPCPRTHPIGPVWVLGMKQWTPSSRLTLPAFAGMKCPGGRCLLRPD